MKIVRTALALTAMTLFVAPGAFATRYHILHHMHNGAHHVRVKMHHGHQHLHNMVYHGHM